MATAVAVVLRTLMLFFVIDTESGFIKSEYLAPAVFMVIMIVAAVLCVFVFSLLSKPKAAKTLPDSLSFKIISPVLALVILYDTFFSTMEYSVSPWQKNLEMIFAVAAAAALVAFTVTEFFGYEYPKLLTAVPVLFWLIRLIIIFTSFSTLSNILDNMFELAALCLILISSLQCAKLACIELDKRKKRLIFATLTATASVCFITSVPRAAVMLSSNAQVLHQNDLPLMTTLVAGIYFLSFVLNCYPFKADNHRYR